MAANDGRMLLRGAACALALALAGCVDQAEQITDVPFVTYNAPISVEGRDLPVASVTAARYGTVQIDTLAAGEFRYTLVSHDSVVVEAEFRNVEALSGGARYGVWLRTAAGATPVTGSLTQVRITVTSPRPGETVTQTDTIAQESQTTSFTGGPATDLHRFRGKVEGSASGGAGPYLVVTMESSGSAASPGDSRPLWFSLPAPFAAEEPDGTVDHEAGTIRATRTGTATFGWFDLTDPGASRAFAAAGGGRLSARKEAGRFVEVLGQLRELPLPPVGYYYAAWFADREETVSVPAGDVTSPPPAAVALLDADLVATGGTRPADVVLPTGILEARTQIPQSALSQAFGAYARYVVTLEAKRGDAAVRAPGVVVGAAMPDAVVAAGG